jgi:hypothetical protein
MNIFYLLTTTLVLLVGDEAADKAKSDATGNIEFYVAEEKYWGRTLLLGRLAACAQQ